MTTGLAVSSTPSRPPKLRTGFVFLRTVFLGVMVVGIGIVNRMLGTTPFDAANEVASVPSVGASVDPSMEFIIALHPDLVIGWGNILRQTRPR